MNGERRVQHFEQLVSAPGDAASDARQMIEVARRLGHGALFPWPAPRGDAVWDEIARSRHTVLGAANAASLRAEPGRAVAGAGRARDPLALQRGARPGG